MFGTRVITALLLGLVAGPGFGDVDHPCVLEPVFPPDCVEQLGPIGTPPVDGTNEGFLHVSTPVVDPVVAVPAFDGAPAKLYVLNPLGDGVRVLDATNLTVLADLRVCSRPSALARDEAGSRVFVSCHASHAVATIDVRHDLVVQMIQDRDADQRPLLQEPMGLAVRGETLWVASSQNNRIAQIDLAAGRVVRYLPLPGQDPRDIALTPDGRFLVVANFMAGNRTEPVMNFNTAVLNEATPSGAVCAPLLADPDALAVALESNPAFMDTTHPDYPTIAECYFFAHTFGSTSTIAINPVRADHDVLVLDTASGEVVFSSDVLDQDIGTLNYGLTLDDEHRIYVVSTHARNFLNQAFGNRPILNHLSILQLDPATGALALVAVRDLDASALDEQGAGTAFAAIPHAVARDGERLLIAAAGSDRLVVTDLDGLPLGQVPVGFGPKGIATAAGGAWVYEATALTVSRVALPATPIDDLTAGVVTRTADIGDNGLSQSERIGARLFQSAEFASNGTFACASCHPDGHLDGLLWQLNDTDGLRSTMTVREIAETAAYHWDGSKCNQVKILQDGIVNLFGNPDGPSDCQMQTMIDFMDGLVRPHSPHRAPDDRFSDEARIGAIVMHRARSKSIDDDPRTCTFRIEDPSVESFYLDAIGDPHKSQFAFNGGGGPFPATLVAESCSVANCHVAPHTESDGFRNGNPDEGLIDGFQAVSTLGVWDRMVTQHDARTTRAKFIEALDINRAFHGAEAIDPGGNYTGPLAAHGFTDTFFRHAEFNFDGNDATNGYTLSSALTQFMIEEEELQSGAASVTVVLDVARRDDAAVERLVSLLRTAALEGKIALRAVGMLGGAMTALTFDTATRTFVDDQGNALTTEQLDAALIAGDALVLYGAPRPGALEAAAPKLRALERDTSPILCSEGYAEYQAAAAVGEFGVPLTLRSLDAIDGSRVLIDGKVVGAALSGLGPDYNWTLPRAPDSPTILAVQLMAPDGMLSNSLPLPVVARVVAALEPEPVAADRDGATVRLGWPGQFGITGPGTRYDVYRGDLHDLNDLQGAIDLGECISPDGWSNAFIDDGLLPAPGRGFYYLVRAQNQVNASTWGDARRDEQIEASVAPCTKLF